MAKAADEADLEALIGQLEALPTGACESGDPAVELLLSQLAAVCRDTTYGDTTGVDNARELGERACLALLRLPVTWHSETVADAFWEVARFNGARRLNPYLVVEAARRLVDVAALMCSSNWARRAHVLSSAMHVFCANYALAIEEAWAALKLARTSSSTITVAAAWNNLGLALVGVGLHQYGLHCFERALDTLESTPSPEAYLEVRVAALNNVALSYMCLGDFGRGLKAASEARRFIGNDASTRALLLVITGGCSYVRLLLETGNVEQSRELCDELLHTCTKVSSETFTAEVLAADGLCLVFEGNVGEGLSRVRRALETLRGLRQELRWALMNAIRAHELAGEFAVADMYRRELALHNRLVQQEGMLELHRSHLRRLQDEEGGSLVTLERKAEMVERLAITTEMREDPAGVRVFRVGSLARLLAQELGWSGPDAEALEVAARLHDIGKIAVADEIVAARRPLTADETQAMRAHCQVGAELLRQTELENARLAADVAAYHHEAWDGSGYPHGIGGTAIPLAARMVAVADAFDAMTRDRPYRPAVGVEVALAQLQAGAGSRYDPVLVPQFVALVRRLLDGAGDFDAYLAEPAARSGFMQVHRQLARRLAEPGSSLE